jgi:hypothetical protein
MPTKKEEILAINFATTTCLFAAHFLAGKKLCRYIVERIERRHWFGSTKSENKRNSSPFLFL